MNRPFTPSRSFASLITITAGLAGCGGASPDPGRLALPLIMDELHNGGTEGFLFLPPMVPKPGAIGEIVPFLPIEVAVDELGDDGSVVATVATFTTDAREKDDRVMFHVEKGRPAEGDPDGDDDPLGYYLARWNTDARFVSSDATYRVRVRVPASAGKHRELGFADVDVVRNQKQFRAVNTQDFVPLVEGRTLRIKFRVDRSAVDADNDGVLDWKDNCPGAANADQTDSVRNGVGDSGRCDQVKCAPTDACHGPGKCDPRTGACISAALPDGTKCAIANAAAICKAGVCALVACNASYADCNAALKDGCEIDLSTDGNNCGACGKVCGQKTACKAGSCEPI